MGGEAAAKILSAARDAGVRTSADVLAEGDPGLLEWIAPALEHLDILLPNDDQVVAFTGAPDLESGCRALVERGVGMVAATCGADGALLVSAEGSIRVPAFEVEVVDTTGCGDAFSAGFIVGLAMVALRRAPPGSAARPRLSSREAWAVTTASSTWPRRTASRTPRRSGFEPEVLDALDLTLLTA